MNPHSIAMWQQSVVLLYQRKADVLESDEATASSPSLTLQFPAVMRLRNAVATQKSAVRFSRINVYARDRFRCCYDGKRYAPRDRTYDRRDSALAGRQDELRGGL